MQTKICVYDFCADFLSTLLWVISIQSRPKDFTFEEMKTLLEMLGYAMDNKGKTSGSRVLFCKGDCKSIRLHKPHSRKYLLPAQVADVINVLAEEGLI